MIYYDTENRKKLIEAIIEEARILGVDLVSRDLDRFYMYYTDRYKTLDSLIDRIVGDIRGWFSDNRLSKKEMCIALGTEPWTGEHVRIQTRCKR